MSLFYREVAPSADVSPFVLSFWEFAVADGDFPPVQHEIFPDGCVSLFFHRNKKFNFEKFIFAFNGLSLESHITQVFPTDIFWGMRFSPASCAFVLGENPANFIDLRMTEAERFPHLTEGILEKLKACENFDEAISVYENRLRDLKFDSKFYDAKTAQAVEIIEETGGEIKISELAAQLNLSPRQLERRFKKSSGLTPKQFSRTRRIRATAMDLVENKNINWANRAAEMGFADQAHLTHEFVSLTKRSPNSFAEKVKQIEHGNLIK